MDVFCTACVTPDGVREWPLHQHAYWEVMCYWTGRGEMRTSCGRLRFAPGTLIVVPPGVPHGSVSESGFRNISIGADFSEWFRFPRPVALHTDPDADGPMLARCILKHHQTTDAYLSCLLDALAQYVLRSVSPGGKAGVAAAVRAIQEAMVFGHASPDCNATALLRASGYAEDYIRAQFKKQTGLSPIAYLTRLRVEHAAKLIEIYAHTLSVGELAERCGFTDSVYFSHQFKAVTGASPRAYARDAQGRA